MNDFTKTRIEHATARFGIVCATACLLYGIFTGAQCSASSDKQDLEYRRGEAWGKEQQYNLDHPQK